MRSRLRSILALLTLTLAAFPLAAQDAPLREGFFIGFGFGGGGGTVAGDDDASGGAGWLTLGGTVSPKIRLAADFEGFAPDANGGDVTLGTSTFAVLFYPSATSNFFLKGGVGASSVTIDGPGPDGTGVGFGNVFGLGFDARVGRKVSVTPQLTWFGGRTGDIEDDDGNPVANDVGFGVAALSIGVVFH
jgi:hypothetical protein